MRVAIADEGGDSRTIKADDGGGDVSNHVINRWDK